MSRRNAISEPSTRNTFGSPPGAQRPAVIVLPGKNPSSINRSAMSSGRSRLASIACSPSTSSAKRAGADADRLRTGFLLKLSCMLSIVSFRLDALSSRMIDGSKGVDGAMVDWVVHAAAGTRLATTKHHCFVLGPHAKIYAVPEIAPKEFYSRQEALRLLSISERQLRDWERNDLIRAGETLNFSDLIALRTLIKLRRDRVPLVRIRQALAALRTKMREVNDPLRELKVIADGRKVRVEIAGQQMEAVSGQLLFDFNQTEMKRLFSFPDQSKTDQRARRESAEAWFQKGLELEHSGAPLEEAVAAYETAARLDPTSAGALVNLGTISFNSRMWGKAEQYYKAAIEVDPHYPLAHFNLANLFDERGNPRAALEHYLKAVELHPKYADAHYNLALLYQGQGKVMEAVRHWKAYLKLDAGSAWGAIARRELDKLRRSTVLQGRNSNVAAASAESGGNA